MDYIIGVDIGTSNTKAIAMSVDGTIIGSENRSYASLTGITDQHELDPELLSEATLSVLQKIILETGSSGILRGISFSAAMHGLMAVDTEGKPLTNLITWADLRSREYSGKLKETDEGKRIYQKTGTPIHPMSPLCKICWIRDHLPQVFSAAYKFISIKEFIFYRLFHEYIIDHSIASATGLFDIHELKWNKESLQFASITEEQLSKPVSTSHIVHSITSEYLSKYSIPEGIPFIIGASDGCLANVGSNATQPGDASLTIGTSGAIRMITNRINEDPKCRLFNYLLTEKLFVVGGPINNGGILLKWYAENFLHRPFDSSDDFKWFVDEAMKADNGSDGLIFLPYIHGERAPIWDPLTKGVFFGIHARHNQSHFMRAIVEGICFALYDVAVSLRETIGSIQQLYASGGFIRSTKWLQLVADIFDTKVTVSNNADASSIGAAILGMNALGLINKFPDSPFHSNSAENYFPDKEKNRVYMKYYEVYASLYPSLKDQFVKISNLRGVDDY